MKKGVIDKRISEFVGRLENDFSIDKMAGVDIDKLAEFNIDLYKGEFNEAGYSDKKEIKKIWNWKYNMNPASGDMDNFGWLLNYRGTLIGQFRIIPVNFKIGTSYIRGTWGTDLAIVKKYRNVGVSAFLTQKVREKIGQKFPLHLICGMNPNSYNLLTRSGFVDLGRIPRYIKIFDLKTILECYGFPVFLSTLAQRILGFSNKSLSFARAPKRTHIAVEEVNGFDESFKDFWYTVSRHYKCAAKKDRDFLKWRYMDQPLWAYRILRVKRDGKMKGFAVLREGIIKNGKLKGKSIGVISDILVDPEDRESIDGLLAGITRHFSNGGKKDEKTALIKCDILNGMIQKALSGNGFIEIKSENKFVLDVSTSLSEADRDLVTTRGNWHITSGDSDLDFN